MVLHRKDAIVLTTIQIIDESGLLGLSTREIARRVGISEGTIFKHYKSKNEIILSVLDYFSKFDDDIIKTITLRKMSPRAAILFFISSYAEYYENYPAITALIESYNELSNNVEIAPKVKAIYYKRLKAIQNIIKKAQESGVIEPKVNCESLSDIIEGLFKSICLRWRLSKRGYPLKEHILLTLNLVLDRFMKE